MAEQPIWRRCLACNRQFCVGEEASPVVHPRDVRNCPFCGSDRLQTTYSSDPAEPGRWR
jgi:rRNA maturation endonuclease Nob1